MCRANIWNSFSEQCIHSTAQQREAGLWAVCATGLPGSELCGSAYNSHLKVAYKE